MRLGFVGCGRHAQTSLYPTLAALDIELVATCARTLAHAEAAARRFGAASSYDDVKRMLAEVKPDAVAISVPPDSYAEVLRLCIDAGVPAFLEKPGARDAEEAADLAASAKAADVPVMVGYMKRFAPAYRRAKELIREDDFGPASIASFTFMMGEFGMPFADYVIDNPVHHFDLARYLLGELTDVQARPGTTGGGRHALSVTARSDAGALVNFQLGSMGSWRHQNESVDVYGVGSSVHVVNVDTCVLRPGSGPEQVTRPTYTVPLAANFTSTTMGFAPELAHFRDVVVNGVPCESDLESAAATLRVAAAVVAQLG